jgi:phospholipid/cholesterol/gamma-HCH transport system substrate-binding protein
MSRFLAKGQFYVAYFNESVQGLDVDSPVKYRGVSIGRVARISVAPDSKLIQVLLKIESGQRLDSEIVAQLKAVGITGSVFVELDRKAEGEPDLSPPISFPSEYPIVASKPSNISELLRGIDEVLDELKSLDLKGIADAGKATLENLNQVIADADVKGISTSIKSSFESIGPILDNQRWDGIMASVEEAGQSLKPLMNKANKSFGRMERVLARVEGIAADNEKTIKASIEDFKLAMENANIFLGKGSTVLSGLQGIVADNDENIKAALEDFRHAMKNANIILDRGASLVSETDDSISEIKNHLLIFSQNLETASENLNRLIENLSDQPSQLIFDKVAVPRDLESEDAGQ